MKNIRNIQLSILLVAALISCNSAATDKINSVNADSSIGKAGQDLSNNADYQKGLALITKTDCFSCHDLNEAKIGPSYAAVASKYEGSDQGTIDSLADKMINGSRGVWGQAAMPPHPSLVKGDAAAIVKYILLLKN